MKKSLLVILAVAASVYGRTVEVDDLMRLVTISDPQISPDGKSIAAVVARPNVAEDRYDEEIVLVDIASGTQRTLTYERKGVNAPRWSPSGDRLAFLADSDDKPQIFIMNVELPRQQDLDALAPDKDLVQIGRSMAR